MAWPFQQQFQIYIFGEMILQMKQKTKFWKIEPCNFNKCTFFFWGGEGRQTVFLSQQRYFPKWLFFSDRVKSSFLHIKLSMREVGRWNVTKSKREGDTQIYQCWIQGSALWLQHPGVGIKKKKKKKGQDKTGQDKTRQDKTRQDKTRQDKKRQDKKRKKKRKEKKEKKKKQRKACQKVYTKSHKLSLKMKMAIFQLPWGQIHG